jgi:hypothetical protein
MKQAFVFAINQRVTVMEHWRSSRLGNNHGWAEYFFPGVIQRVNRKTVWVHLDNGRYSLVSKDRIYDA